MLGSMVYLRKSSMKQMDRMHSEKLLFVLKINLMKFYYPLPYNNVQEVRRSARDI